MARVTIAIRILQYSLRRMYWPPRAHAPQAVLVVRYLLLEPPSIRSMLRRGMDQTAPSPLGTISVVRQRTISDVIRSMGRQIFPGSLALPVAVSGPILVLTKRTTTYFVRERKGVAEKSATPFSLFVGCDVGNEATCGLCLWCEWRYTKCCRMSRLRLQYGLRRADPRVPKAR